MIAICKLIPFIRDQTYFRRVIHDDHILTRRLILKQHFCYQKISSPCEYLTNADHQKQKITRDDTGDAKAQSNDRRRHQGAKNVHALRKGALLVQ